MRNANVYAGALGQRPAVILHNDRIELTVLIGGGHIAAIRRRDNPVNPLWIPGWETIDPGLRRLANPAVFGEALEGQLLSGIYGHNLCVDVFGAHSDGEVAAGLSFHGEAGMVAWEVLDHHVGETEAWFVIGTHLRHTAMVVERHFALTVGCDVVRVTERFRSTCGFQRAIGRAQHVSLGADFLRGTALFSCNADRGMTWPEAIGPAATFPIATEFDYPIIPRVDGETSDWRRFPTSPINSDLCTLRIQPDNKHGWFVAVQPRVGLALTYVWERCDYPWLMTWEENLGRTPPPWNSRTLARGLEFSSYAFAQSRQAMVERGRLFDTPCFEWLDAYQEKVSHYSIGLFEADTSCDEAPILVADGDGYRAAGTDWHVPVAAE